MARTPSHYLDVPVVYVPFFRKARVDLLRIASFHRPGLTMIYLLYVIRFCLCLSFFFFFPLTWALACYDETVECSRAIRESSPQF